MIIWVGIILVIVFLVPPAWIIDDVLTLVFLILRGLS